MTHTNWLYRRRRSPAEAREFREAQRRRVAKRWETVHAAKRNEPPRETRAIELTIRDSHRPMRMIRLTAEETEHGWSRWTVTENGQPAGARPWGKNAIAKAIARTM